MLKELISSISLQTKDVTKHPLPGNTLFGFVSVAQKHVGTQPDMSTDMFDSVSLQIASDAEMKELHTNVTEAI